MSPSAAEEASKTAQSFIGALRKEWPLSLALVVMNICLLVFCWMILDTVARQREREVGLLYADHKEVRDLLARCVVSPTERRTDLFVDPEKLKPPMKPPMKTETER